MAATDRVSDRDRQVTQCYHQVMEQLLTVAEVAELLRVSTMTVYRLIRSGELPAVRVGRNYRVRRGDLDSYLQEQVVEPEQRDAE